jgi:hypothetical protein
MFGIILTSFGQSDTIDCDSKIDTLTGLEIYTYVDSEPTPKRGEKELYNEFRKIEVPTCMNSYGRLIIAFIVDTEGKIEGKRVLIDVEGTDYAEQVLKLIDNIEWLPGICDDIAVPALRMVSVRICLQ